MAPVRDVALILLILEAMVMMLVPAAVIGATWYGVRWVRRKLPPLFAQVRRILALVRLYVDRTGAAMVAPLITIYAVAAQIRATWTSLISLVREEN